MTSCLRGFTRHSTSSRKFAIDLPSSFAVRLVGVTNLLLKFYYNESIANKLDSCTVSKTVEHSRAHQLSTARHVTILHSGTARPCTNKPLVKISTSTPFTQHNQCLPQLTQKSQQTHPSVIDLCILLHAM